MPRRPSLPTATLPRAQRHGRPRDGWRAAFAAIEALKNLWGRPSWLRGFRVFESTPGGEVQVEVEAVEGAPVAALPKRYEGVTLRFRAVPARNEPFAELSAG